jgi:hypothetical protein
MRQERGPAKAPFLLSGERPDTPNNPYTAAITVIGELPLNSFACLLP